MPYHTFWSGGFLWYLAIGACIGIPFALAYQRAINETGTREPNGWIEKIFFQEVQEEDEIRRMQLQFWNNYAAFLVAVIVIFFWFPLLGLLIFRILRNETRLIPITIRRVYINYRISRAERITQRWLKYMDKTRNIIARQKEALKKISKKDMPQ